MKMDNTKRLKSIGALAIALCAAQAGAQVTFYEHDGYQGRSFHAERLVQDFTGYGFNDRASSVVVQGGAWQVCEDAGFNGRCVMLQPGSYPALSQMGLNDRVSSARLVGAGETHGQAGRGGRPDGRPEYRRQRGERLFDADVVAVRAVYGAQQQCWMEREQVNDGRGDANVPGAVLGAVIGGVLGHQIGGGTGKKVATVGGAVAGAAVGANVNRRGEPEVREVQRCADSRRQGPPEYWDVTYVFRGQEHHMQTTSPPGATVTVNRNGEPRI